MSFFAWLILLLCFLSFGGGFTLAYLAQYGPFTVVLFIGSTVYVPYKLTHKPSLEFDDRVSKERREEAFKRYMKVVRKQNVEDEVG